MNDLLFLLNSELDCLGIDYEYEVRTQENKYPYFVGEVQVTEVNPEYGEIEGIATLYGFNVDSFLPLYRANKKIQDCFENYIREVDKGSVSIEYSSMMSVTDINPRLKRIDITLNWKVWKGR